MPRVHNSCQTEIIGGQYYEENARAGFALGVPKDMG